MFLEYIVVPEVKDNPLGNVQLSGNITNPFTLLTIAQPHFLAALERVFIK